MDFSAVSEFQKPEESPGFLLWRASILWRREIESVLKPLDLTHPQFVVLATCAWLRLKEETVSQAAIGRQSGLDPNTTSQILRSLEAKGLIERRHLKDERSKTPVLTEQGRTTLEKALPAVEKADREFFSAVNLKKESGWDALRSLAKI